MTDRDTFAAAALTWLIVSMREESMYEVCESAYGWADAMIRIRGTAVYDNCVAQPEIPCPVTEPMPKEKRAEVSDTDPVAWAVVYPNDAVAVIAFKRQDADERASASDRIVPLYRHPQPTLTDAEREAVEKAMRSSPFCYMPEAKTLEALLARLPKTSTPPDSRR